MVTEFLLTPNILPVADRTVSDSAVVKLVEVKPPSTMFVLKATTGNIRREGAMVGTAVGLRVGTAVVVGERDGVFVEGERVGAAEGAKEGAKVGVLETASGDKEGAIVDGAKVGAKEGSNVGSKVGASVGSAVGAYPVAFPPLAYGATNKMFITSS